MALYDTGVTENRGNNPDNYSSWTDYVMERARAQWNEEHEDSPEMQARDIEEFRIYVRKMSNEERQKRGLYDGPPFPLKELSLGMAKFVFIAVLIFGGIFGGIYGCNFIIDTGLDSTGRTSHQLKTDVLIHHEWLPGEVRECHGDPRTSIMCSNNIFENNDSAKVWTFGDGHTFVVTYWGRVDRGIETDWNCTRGETDMVCKATD